MSTQRSTRSSSQAIEDVNDALEELERRLSVLEIQKEAIVKEVKALKKKLGRTNDIKKEEKNVVGIGTNVRYSSKSNRNFDKCGEIVRVTPYCFWIKYSNGNECRRHKKNVKELK